MNEYYNSNQEVVVDYDRSKTSGLNAFMMKVFGWMFAGLLLSGAVSLTFIYLMATNAAVQGIAANPVFLIAVVVGELGLVIALNAAINKISSVAAKLMYCLYAALTGVTLSYTLLFYAGMPGVIVKAFVMTSIFFGVMAVFGMTTKSDLTSAGRIFSAGLIAIIIAMVVNMFLRSSGLEYIICIAGIAIFTGLTAYDTQKLKGFYLQQAAAAGPEYTSKISIIGALMLYLDFINLFLMLLRIFGRRD